MVSLSNHESESLQWSCRSREPLMLRQAQHEDRDDLALGRRRDIEPHDESGFCGQGDECVDAEFIDPTAQQIV